MPLVNFTWEKPKIMTPRTEEHFQFHYFSRIFALKILKRIKPKKDKGLDNLPPALLKDCVHLLGHCHISLIFR